MVASINHSYQISVSFIEDHVISSPLQQRIAINALAAIGFFVAGLLIRRSNNYTKNKAENLRSEAENLRIQGKLGEAASKFEEALRIEPKNAFALSRYADTLCKQEKFDEAVLKYEESLLIDSEDDFAFRGYNLTFKKIRLNRDLRPFQEILIIDPKNVAALRRCAEILRELGKFTEAAEKLEKILEIDPQNLFAINAKAQVLEALNQNQA